MNYKINWEQTFKTIIGSKVEHFFSVHTTCSLKLTFHLAHSNKLPEILQGTLCTFHRLFNSSQFMGSHSKKRAQLPKCQLTSSFECCSECDDVDFDFVFVPNLVWFCHVNLYRYPHYSHPITVDHWSLHLNLHQRNIFQVYKYCI